MSTQDMGREIGFKIEDEIDRANRAIGISADDAIAAGDGTLHGAIDYWQARAYRAEAALAECRANFKGE